MSDYKSHPNFSAYTLHFTPSFIHLLCYMLPASAVSDVHTLRTGGDAARCAKCTQRTSTVQALPYRTSRIEFASHRFRKCRPRTPTAVAPSPAAVHTAHFRVAFASSVAPRHRSDASLALAAAAGNLSVARDCVTRASRAVRCDCCAVHPLTGPATTD